MPIELDEVWKALGVPWKWRNRVRYQAMASALHDVSNRMLDAGQERSAVGYWLSKYELNDAYLHVPPDTPRGNEGEVLVKHLNEAYLDKVPDGEGVTGAADKALAEAAKSESSAASLPSGSKAPPRPRPPTPTPTPTPSSEPKARPTRPARPPGLRPGGRPATELPLTAVEVPCSRVAGSAPEVESRLRDFVAGIWAKRTDVVDGSTLAGKTEDEMRAYIYGHHYTRLPEKRALNAADRRYLDGLRAVFGQGFVGKEDAEFYSLSPKNGVTHRVYVNVPSGEAATALRTAQELAETNDDVLFGKVAGAVSAGERPDTVVVYVKGEAGVRAIVEALQQKNLHFQDPIPALTSKRGTGIGVARDPQMKTKSNKHPDGLSFGENRSDQIATALYDLLHRNPDATEEQAVQAVEDHFERLGLDPKHPDCDYSEPYPDLTREPARAETTTSSSSSSTAPRTDRQAASSSSSSSSRPKAQRFDERLHEQLEQEKRKAFKEKLGALLAGPPGKSNSQSTN